MTWQKAGVAVVASVALIAPQMVSAQAAPHQSGTVKASTDSGLTLTTAAGQDYTVAITGDTKVMVVAPGTAAKDATAGTKADVATGDKAIVMGTAGDTGTELKATKIYLMKSAAISPWQSATTRNTTS